MQTLRSSGMCSAVYGWQGGSAVHSLFVSVVVLGDEQRVQGGVWIGGLGSAGASIHLFLNAVDTETFAGLSTTAVGGAAGGASVAGAGGAPRRDGGGARLRRLL